MNLGHDDEYCYQNMHYCQARMELLTASEPAASCRQEVLELTLSLQSLPISKITV